MSAAPTAVYLYCFAPAAHSSLPAVRPIDPRGRLARDVCGDVAAIWSSVPRGLFCGAEAESRWQDPDWLAAGVCLHEAVVEETMRITPVFPVRFATLFTSLESLHEFLAAHRSEISGTLSRLSGKREWAVKGYLNRTQALERTNAGRRLQALPASPCGTRYLLRKRLQAEAEAELREWIQDACRQAALRLQQHADNFRERKPVDLGGSEDLDLVLNWALLLGRQAELALAGALEELSCEYAPNGVRLVMSGPLPPYSFTPPLGSGQP
jgi:Gas vesicle synthesis protein GvpL/GvpF